MTPDPTHDDSILTPDDLEVTPDNETVTQLDENRYVVRSDSSTDLEKLRIPMPDQFDAVDDDERTRQPPTESSSNADGPLETVDDDPAAAAGGTAELAAASEAHGVDITLKTDGELAHFRTDSNDVREVFAEMLTWYASQLDDDMSPTDALQVLLATTDLEQATPSR
ncbi:DUF7500 family protein [Natronosalvus amylolyticus]|uniref:DUF7500 family protein n=1 Tax=Natronosalvus amylolyticus TaxID=2961994 RepID=UPI0020C9AF6B|nr:hypothetical protein [Natronosalvus amylolyticus]